ncbi:MAG: sugar-transfer associated ATP-grasp domain-containing protein [Bacteroidota bacterium]
MLIRKIQKGVKHFQTVSKTAHKPYLFVLCEGLYWVIVLKGQIGYYMDYKLYLKGRRLADYLAPVEFLRIEKRLNTPEYYPILEDKYFFYKILEGKDFRSPRNLYLIDPSGIYQMEIGRYICEEEFLQNELDGFCKLINGFGGKMIYLIDIVNGNLRINKKNTTFSEFLKLIGHKKFLIQERIIQHDEMNALNPSCLNTIRLLTIRTGQTIHLFHDYLRIGINDSYVDNGLSGNIMVGIREGGRLMEKAYSSGLDVPTYTMDRHPQTNKIFENFTIPFYNESVEMAKSMHQLFQQFFMIGWDIGITPDGPVAVEGNNITTLYPFQVIYGGMRSAFRDLAGSCQKYL